LIKNTSPRTFTIVHLKVTAQGDTRVSADSGGQMSVSNSMKESLGVFEKSEKFAP
jgi:hypothetical protein